MHSSSACPDVSGVRAGPGRPVLDNPKGILPFTGRPATAGEIEYARFASRTPHIVVSSKLQTSSWKNTRIVRDLRRSSPVEGGAGRGHACRRRSDSGLEPGERGTG